MADEAWERRWRALTEETGAAGAAAARRGRALHRAGRVLALRGTGAGLEGRVQGSHAQPLRSVVRVPHFGEDAWRTVVGTVAGQARHRARILAGQQPRGLEADLAVHGVALLPQAEELHWSCPCDEDRRPCAHGGAVMEAAAERLRDEPLWLLRLRGRGRQQLLVDLAARHEDPDTLGLGALGGRTWDRPAESFDGAPVEPPTEPLPALHRAGPVPDWPAGPDPLALLGGRVARAAQAARNVLTDLGAGAG